MALSASHIQALLKYLQHLPGQPIPVPNHAFCEELFPNVQPKLPLVQSKTVSSCPVTGAWENNPYLATPSFQGVAERDVSPPLLFSRLSNPSSLMPLG